MFKKEAPIYSAVLLIYLVLITIIGWRIEWRTGFFWLGGFVGMLLYNLDHLVYLLWQNPETSTSAELQRLLKERRFKEALNLLSTTAGQREQLVGHSVIFFSVLIILTFFTLSSTYSLFGKGLVVGLYLYAVVNQGLLLIRSRDLSSWFWQVGLKPNYKGQAFYFLGLVLILIYFTRYLV